MSTVNGFRHQRLSRGLTMQQMSDLSGVSAYIIRCCEEGNVENITLSRLLALSSALGISLSEGLRVRETPGIRQRPRRREPRNILENYMSYWELTTQGMAVILDVSPQTVSVQCGKSSPALKYVKRLAEEENMTVGSFIHMYGNMPLPPS
ncbi:MAG: helix-turn-helix domain-containing protein [Oscillospiraceae bacterium]